MSEQRRRNFRDARAWLSRNDHEYDIEEGMTAYEEELHGVYGGVVGEIFFGVDQEKRKHERTHELKQRKIRERDPQGNITHRKRSA